MKDLLKHYQKTIQKFKDRHKPKNPKPAPLSKSEDLEKAEINPMTGKWEPTPKDPEGMAHPEFPQYVKGTSSRPGKLPVWKYRSDIAQQQDDQAAAGIQDLIAKHPQKAQLLQALHQKLLKDPDRHSVHSGHKEPELRIRHLAAAARGEAGHSLEFTDSGIKITAERHNKGMPLESHTWHFDGKGLKFAGSSPISKVSGGGSHDKTNPKSRKFLFVKSGQQEKSSLVKSYMGSESSMGSRDDQAVPPRLEHSLRSGPDGISPSSINSHLLIKSYKKRIELVRQSSQATELGLDGLKKSWWFNHFPDRIESLAKSKKDAKAMLPGPEHKPVIDWAYATMPNDNWAMWFLRNYKKDPTVWNNKTKEDVKHFAGMASVAKEIDSHRFDKDHTIEQGISDLKQKEDAWTARQGEGLVDAKGEKMIDLGNGLAWWDLGVGSCSQEGAAMGHCGNTAAVTQGDRVLSLRQQKGSKYEPQLTFIENNGWLGEMKGRANTKPSAKYHGAIKALLEHPRIKHIAGGGYAAESNFELNDLSDADKEAILKKKPDLDLAGWDDPSQLMGIVAKANSGGLKVPPKHQEWLEDVEQKAKLINKAHQMGYKDHNQYILDNFVNKPHDPSLDDQEHGHDDSHLFLARVLKKDPETIRAMLNSPNENFRAVALANPQAADRESLMTALNAARRHDGGFSHSDAEMIANHPAMNKDVFKEIIKTRTDRDDIPNLAYEVMGSGGADLKKDYLSDQDVKEIAPYIHGHTTLVKRVLAQNHIKPETVKQILRNISTPENIKNLSADDFAQIGHFAGDKIQPEDVSELYGATGNHLLGLMPQSGGDVLHAALMKDPNLVYAAQRQQSLHKLTPEQTKIFFDSNPSIHKRHGSTFPNQDIETLKHTAAESLSQDNAVPGTLDRLENTINNTSMSHKDLHDMIDIFHKNGKTAIQLMAHPDADDSHAMKIIDKSKADDSWEAKTQAMKQWTQITDRAATKPYSDFVKNAWFDKNKPTFVGSVDTYRWYSDEHATPHIKNGLFNLSSGHKQAIIDDDANYVRRNKKSLVPESDLKDALKSEHHQLVHAAAYHPSITDDALNEAVNYHQNVGGDRSKHLDHITNAMSLRQQAMNKSFQAIQSRYEALKKVYENKDISPADLTSSFGHTWNEDDDHAHIASYKTKRFYHHVFHSTPSGYGPEYYTHVLSTDPNPMNQEAHIGMAEVMPIDIHSPRNHEPVQVSSINVKHVGQGHGEELYHGMLNHHGHIVSDQMLSSGAQKTWMNKLRYTPGAAFKPAIKTHESHELWIDDPETFQQKLNIQPLNKSINTYKERLAKMDNQYLPKQKKKEEHTLDYSKMRDNTPSKPEPDVGEYWKAPDVKHAEVLKEKQLKDKMIERHSKNPKTQIVAGKNKTLWVKNKSETMNKASETEAKIAALKQKYAEPKMPSFKEKTASIKDKYNKLMMKKTMAAPQMMSPAAGAVGMGAMGMGAMGMGAMGMDPMMKDNMPHPPKSPEDSAHDVAEEKSPLKEELKTQKTSAKRQELLRHLRSLKDSGKLRSKQNQEHGKD